MSRHRAQSLVKWTLLASVLIALAGGLIYMVRLVRPAVTVTEVVEGPAVQAFYATGTLEPADREHAIRAPVEGFIRAPSTSAGGGGTGYIGKGNPVSRGQVLAVIYNEGFQYAFDKARANLNEKQARANKETSPVLQELDAKILNYGELVQAAQREFERYSASKDANVVAQSDYDRALDRLKTVNAEFESFKAQKAQSRLLLARELAEAESALKIADWNLDQTKIISPVDGFVIDQPQQIGARVGINDLIVTVANTDPSNLVMRAQVDEEDVTKVEVPRGGVAGLAAQVVRMSLYAFPGQIFNGRVVRIYPKADPERRTFEVDVAIEKSSPRMQAGMTGELAFELASKENALVAPAQALQDGRIWTIRDGRLADANVVVGLRGVERIEILSGLKAGDVVVISPVTELAPGKMVRVGQSIDPRVAAGLNKPKAKEIFRGGF